MTKIRIPEINLVIVAGRLTRDPEVRFLPSGKAVAKIGLASSRRYLNKTTNNWEEEVAFVDVTAWGDAAQRIKDRLHKGSPVLVEGRLKYREWDAKDGTKRRSLDVEARRVQFLEYQLTQSAPETEEAVAPAATVAVAAHESAQESADAEMEEVAL
ncbi:MAG: single-stranded DNA-binding protein [Elusimicrobiota bacterium]